MLERSQRPSDIMKILGLEFASWDVPLDRRLQTLAVFLFTCSFMFTGLVGPIALLYVLFTPYYYLTLMYLVWLYYDWDIGERGGRGLQCMRRMSIWKLIASYFPMRLIKTADLDPEKNYVFGYHPHGISGIGCICNFISEATGFADLFPGIKPHVMTLAGNFRVPIYRDMLLAMGFCSVSKESISWIIDRKRVGNAVVIVVGGAAEALDARPGEATLTLKNRKGFVKLAIKHGASLVPVYSFGENDLYNQVYNPVGSRLRTVQNKLEKIIGVSTPIFNGRGVFNYSFGFLPHRKKLIIVVGSPIEVKQVDNPGQEEVDKVHEEYLRQLTQLYNRFRDKYGNPEKDLVFI